MARIKGTLIACLGAALIVLAAAGVKAREHGADVASNKDAAVSGLIVIF